MNWNELEYCSFSDREECVSSYAGTNGPSERMLFHTIDTETDDHRCVYENDVLTHRIGQISSRSLSTDIDMAFLRCVFVDEL